jgi:two-component system, LuxR family, response regulator FixJ
MVVDMGLPEMSGIEMCEHLKRSGRALPTILISGGAGLIALALAQQSDAVAVFLKSSDETPLLAAIERALALSGVGHTTDSAGRFVVRPGIVFGCRRALIDAAVGPSI